MAYPENYLNVVLEIKALVWPVLKAWETGLSENDPLPPAGSDSF